MSESGWIVRADPDYVEPPSYSWNWWLYQDLFAEDRSNPKVPVALWQLAMRHFKGAVRVTETQAQEAMEYAAKVHNWPTEPPFPIEAKERVS